MDMSMNRGAGDSLVTNVVDLIASSRFTTGVTMPATKATANVLYSSANWATILSMDEFERAI